MNHSDDKIADYKQDVRKTTAFETIDTDERNAKWINRKSGNTQVAKR